MRILKTVLLNCLYILCASNVFAQMGSVKGKLISEVTQESMPYVNISVDGIPSTVSNKNGVFLIESLSYGKHSLSFSFIGFKPISLDQIEITQQNRHIHLGKIKMQEKQIRIPEIVVQRVRNNYNEKYKGSNHVVAKKQLDQIQPLGSEEVLKTVSGVNVASDMGISNRLNVGIRGSYPRRADKIMVLEDGTPIAPAPYLSPSAYYNPQTWYCCHRLLGQLP